VLDTRTIATATGAASSPPSSTNTSQACSGRRIKRGARPVGRGPDIGTASTLFVPEIARRDATLWRSPLAPKCRGRASDRKALGLQR
jgi:hypothetical protein